MRRVMPWPLLIALLFATGVLSQCTSPSATMPGASIGQSNTGPTHSASGSEDGTAPAPTEISAGASQEYRIGPQDLLQVTVYQVPDLSAKGVLVDARGDVVMPLIGPVHIAGLTTDEAGKVIAATLGKTYLQHPEVFVVLQKSAKRVIVAGAVVKPTAIAPTGGLTLSQAVVEAGGLSDIANGERVHLARVRGNRVKDAVFDLDAILAGKAPDPDVYGGDMIVAEKSGTKVAFSTVKDLLPFTALAGLLSTAF